MKRLPAFFMSFLLITSFLISSAQPAFAYNGREEMAKSGTPNILIAYFTLPENVDSTGVDAVASASIVVKNNTRMGSMEYVAGLIHDTVGGDLFRIETTQEYPLDHAPLVDQAREEQNADARPALKTHVEDFDKYDYIFLGYPIWWSDMPQPLYTFLEEYNFAGKTVIPFVTHGGSSLAGTVNRISSMLPGATVNTNALCISRNVVANTSSADNVVTWAESFELNAGEEPEKSEQRMPECNLSFEQNADGQTFTAVIRQVAGAEYSFDGMIWSDNNTKADCLPNTAYTAYIRMKETDTHYASPTAQVTQTSPQIAIQQPEKSEQRMPECNLSFEQNADGQTFTAVIRQVAGAEYSFDGMIWSDNNTKADCLPNTAYTAYIRMKETDTHYASPTAQVTQITPQLSTQPSENNKPETGQPSDNNESETVQELAAPVIRTLKAKANKSGIVVTVSVRPVSGADRYEVYRTANKRTVKVGTTVAGKTALQDKNPVKNARYYAIALSKDGKKSSAGTTKSIKLANAVKMKKVSSVSNGIRITWTKTKAATKYAVYRSSKKNSGYKRIKVLGKKQLSYTDRTARKNRTYYYKIAVVGKQQPSLLSKASKRIRRK